MLIKKSVHFEKKDIETIDQIAKSEGLNFSIFVRRLVLNYIKKQKGKYVIKGDVK